MGEMQTSMISRCLIVLTRKEVLSKLRHGVFLFHLGLFHLVLLAQVLMDEVKVKFVTVEMKILWW